MQYIGKDVLTHGSLLHLDPKIAWERLRSRAKQGIRKAQKAGVKVVESRDLSQMAKVWYNPDTLTPILEENQKMYLAYLRDELIGGIIVTPVSPNTLFYHYGGSNELGRTIEVNAYLFWHVVEQFNKSEFQYLDVGVSFREELQHYFQKYCTQPYPILFRSPDEEIRPKITLSPFSTGELNWTEQQVTAINTRLFEYFESEFTYMPSWVFALQSALRALKLTSKAKIGVWASIGECSYIELLKDKFGDQFIFEARAQNADAYLICHRWGVPCKEVQALSSGTIPVIEDCRDLFYNQISEEHYGTYGKYAVFDFARWFPMQFGAVLVGEYFSDQEVWNHFYCLDVTKRNIVRELLQIHWLKQDEYSAKRKANRVGLENLFGLLGMSSSISFKDQTPFAFLLNSHEPYSVKSIQERLSQFGVQTEIDEQDGVAALPIHAALQEGQLNYIFGAFRGMINPCHTFVRKDPAKENNV